MFDTSQSDVVSLINAEYTALRTEIGRYQDHQNQLRSLAIIGLAGILTFISTGFDADEAQRRQLGFFLTIAPLIYVAIAGLTVDRSRRILEIAAYLDSHLRDLAISAVGNEGVFKWEKSKRTSQQDQSDRRASRGMRKVLDDKFPELRRSVRPYWFAGMIVAPFVAASLIPAVAGLTLMGTGALSGLEIAVVVADLLTIPLYVYFTKQLAREEQGILTRHEESGSRNRAGDAAAGLRLFLQP